ncbi:hypothetical protein [Burkholderia cenocepacia]|uniref:hypothetical protein n=1 Tax=Burkholderia cenocepacia TaxID=95486 RepID=UPI002AC3282B|nr:hypothetical protein [Burkholderia cenocepacia]
MLERPQHGARGAAPVARGELIDHSVFRRLAQEARTSGQRDGGPVIEPGQTAMHRMRDDLPDWKKRLLPVAKRFHSGSVRAIFSANIETMLRNRRFSPIGGSNAIHQLSDTNHGANSIHKIRTWKKHPPFLRVLGNGSAIAMYRLARTTYNTLINLINILQIDTYSNTDSVLSGAFLLRCSVKPVPAISILRKPPIFSG